MADNTGHKAAKLGDKSSLSSGEQTVPQRKKTPAFQITSVTVVNTRPSTDAGDDSADDLDESHTDDVSRVTDIENETPSFSEDTFSKEDVFFNAATLGSAPVIPTSAQYGLALLGGGEGGANNNNNTQPQQQQQQQQQQQPNNNNNQANAASLSETPSSGVTATTDSTVNNPNKQDSDMRDVHASAAAGCRNERFKVVKIESTVPFKRGRWTCMDYLDHSTLQQQPQQQAIINVAKNLESDPGNVNSVKYCGTDSGVVLTDGVSDAPHEATRSFAVHDHYGGVSAQQQQQQGGVTVAPSVSPGQTLQQAQMVGHMPQSLSQVQNLVVGQQHQQQQHQSLPPHQFQQVMANAQQQQAQSMAFVGAGQQQPTPVMVSQAGYYVPPPAGTVVTSVPLQPPVVSQPVHVQALDSQKVQHVPVAQIPIQQHLTMPAPPTAVITVPASTLMAQTPLAVVMQPASSSPAYVPQSPQIIASQPSLVVASPSPSVPLTTVYQTTASPALVATLPPPSAAAAPVQWNSNAGAAAMGVTPVGGQPPPGAMASADAGSVGPGPPVKEAATQPDSGGAAAAAVVKVVEPPEISKNPEDATVTVTSVVEDAERSSAAARPRDLGGDPDACSLSVPVPRGPPPNTPMSRAASPVPPSDSASGTSAVAIDNKIEQAMDLVKSHLMFAVREEVEVLKERIAELMDRIGQLEMENTILKAHATQEALAQLGQQPQPQQPQPQQIQPQQTQAQGNNGS